MLALWVLSNHNSISDRVLVYKSRAVLTDIVLQDTVLFPIFNVLPVSLERHVEDGIAPKYKLGWRGSCSRVDR